MNTTNLLIQEQETERAKQILGRFINRFDTSYRLLAYHAALPLVLTPELVNYLRVEFLRDENIPWVAEVDLLLSDLCRQVGYELYAMDTAVRAYLLGKMQEELGIEQMQLVAKGLISYVKYLAQNNPYISPKELQTQQWAAMVYLDEQREKALSEITQAFKDAASVNTAIATGLVNRSEMARLANITQELAPQLSAYEILVEYARLVSRVLNNAKDIDRTDLRHSYSVAGEELPSLEMFLPSGSTQEEIGDIFTQLEGFPPLQNFDFEIANIVFEDGETEDGAETPPAINLQPFQFEVANIEVKKSGLSQRKTELIINRRPQQAYGLIEYLENQGNETTLEMMQIPGETFTMGAPDTEEGSRDSERPQHEVTVPTFFMGKYPVTQAQWKFVASLPKVNRELKSDPSNFKGENRPVEQVSWFDAVEYCDRITQHTGKNYRLPSEAEWEYACRASTTTPFHFGKTITSELANYDAEYTYGAGVKGTNRGETTVVGSFGVANAFGLYDMHGNVWEWCADQWHKNYEGAPTDGSAWIENSENNNQSRLLRGGSWVDNPDYCRSAYRYNLNPAYDSDFIGFRVVCGVFSSRTLPSP
ncbi:formylglycine-generating enzyme family protein [Brunnivagina elsteri]|uniref:Sulphatase-modifying factor protein n=1 Tax=Brunnivagina elsteri CCALA 953 TaxID=987040 RepID=A0A2A2TCX6_9CYAN|nr:formylglycine-generating enzyme family protein [Calothrix elsteri]PAX51496.1 Sulphatase-modifying factor protein [Calothrix elsteri CCALA 953]